MVLHRKSFQYQPASWWRSLYRVMALTALLHLDTNQFMLAVASLPAATVKFSLHDALLCKNHHHLSHRYPPRRRTFHGRCGAVVTRKQAFVPRVSFLTPLRILRHLSNGIDIESFASISRGGYYSDAAEDDDDDDDESEGDDDDGDETEDDSDDEVEDSSDDEYDSEEETDNDESQAANNDFYYFLFIDSHLNG
jgi:hypothetical protein